MSIDKNITNQLVPMVVEQTGRSEEHSISILGF